MPKSVPATSPGSVYWQRSSSMSRGWQEDIAWVAEPNPKPDDLLHWLDRVDARHDAPPPGSRSTQPVATLLLSPESTNRMQFHVRCLPARPASASAFAASVDEQ